MMSFVVQAGDIPGLWASDHQVAMEQWMPSLLLPCEDSRICLLLSVSDLESLEDHVHN